MQAQVNGPTPSVSKPNKEPLFRYIWRNKYLYALLVPGVIFFLVFSYLPLYGVQLAFKTYDLRGGIWGSPFVGLDNFRMLLGDAQFLQVFRNTMEISLLKTAFGFPAPIILAILIHELASRKLKRVLQTVFTFPYFLSWVVVSGILLNLLRTDGALNGLITMFGGEKQPFMTDPILFRIMLVVSSIWKEAGWSCIMYMAAIAGINATLYEAAMVDGANRWQRIRHVTWPGLQGMAAILLILTIGNIMNAGFDQIFNLYNPAVFDSAEILDTYVYRITFQLAGDYSFSTAVGLFKGVINCVLLLGANAIVRRLGHSALI